MTEAQAHVARFVGHWAALMMVIAVVVISAGIDEAGYAIGNSAGLAGILSAGRSWLHFWIRRRRGTVGVCDEPDDIEADRAWLAQQRQKQDR